MSKRDIPNILTTIRALAVPYMVYLLVMEGRTDGHVYALGAAIVFYLAAWTDWFDGVLARRWDVISRYGKLVDPLADKLLVMAALIMVSSLGWIEAWVVVAILARDFSVNTLRMLAASEGTVLAAGRGGKWKTALQFVGVSLLILHVDVFGLPVADIGRWLVYASAVLAWVSGAQYFAAYFRAEPSGAAV